MQAEMGRGGLEVVVTETLLLAPLIREGAVAVGAMEDQVS